MQMQSYLSDREFQRKKDEDRMALEESEVVLLRFLVQQLLTFADYLSGDRLCTARRGC